jgi:hypothetical protein
LDASGDNVTLTNDTLSRNNAPAGAGGPGGTPGANGTNGTNGTGGPWTVYGGPGGPGGACSGGGLNLAKDSVTLTNDTLSGNTATGGHGGACSGGGLNVAQGSVTLTSDTLSGNHASGGNPGSGGNGPKGGDALGGGLYLDGGSTATLANTLIAQNMVTAGSATGPDVSGTVASSDHDLIGDGTGSSGLGASGSGDQVGTSASPINPGLGPRQNNGGPTLTMALLPGSPVLDAGSNAFFATLPAPTGLRATVQGPPSFVPVQIVLFYRVTAFNLAGESLASTVVSASTDHVFLIPGLSSVTLSWNAVPGATGYKVYGRSALVALDSRGSELFLGTSPAVASPSFTDTLLITPGSCRRPRSP